MIRCNGENKNRCWSSMVSRLIAISCIGISLLLSGGVIFQVQAKETCVYDANSDGDIDGMDLFAFLQENDPGAVNLFAAEFGRTQCKPCREFLPCDIELANACFEEAALVDPDPAIRVFHAVTRIMVLLYDPDINTLLTDIGLEEEVRSLCYWTAQFPVDTNGEPVLPDLMPSTGTALQLLVDKMLPEINGALAELSGIDDTIPEPFIVLCEELQRPDEGAVCENIEVDFGDVALYRAMLHFMKTLLLIIDAYDLNIEDTAEFIGKLKQDLVVINDYWCDGDPEQTDCLPDFLRLKPNGPAQMAQAKLSFAGAIDNYLAASSFIRNETDSQSDDLISLPQDPGELADEQEFRDLLSDLQCALTGPCLVDNQKIDNPFDLDLTRFFDDPIDIRDYFAGFTQDSKPYCGTFPDPTFNGILPGFDIDTLAGLMWLPVPVTGSVSCDVDGIPCNNIVVAALTCYMTPDSLLDFDKCDVENSIFMSSPGGYELFLETGEKEVRMAAFLDMDADSRLSPGDYYGLYPAPFDVTSQNCMGPGNIDVTITEAVTGFKGWISSNGQPAENIAIEIYEADCGNWIGSVRSDHNGYYAVNLQPDTPVEIWINTYSRPYVGGWWNGTEVVETCSQAMTITPGSGSTIVNITLDPAGSISGVVTDQSDTPLPNVWIEAYDYDWGYYINSTHTDQNGLYTLNLNRLYSGTCRVGAFPSNNYNIEYYNDKPDWASADPVSPGPNHISGINFQLTPGAEVSGTVSD